MDIDHKTVNFCLYFEYFQVKNVKIVFGKNLQKSSTQVLCYPWKNNCIRTS